MSATRRRCPPGAGLWIPVAIVAALVAATIAGGGAADPTAAQLGVATSTTNPGGPPVTRPVTSRPGRIAYVSLTGEVIVAESDGSGSRVIGTGAVANKAGLAPLAWSPGGSKIAYVRADKALVLAPVKGGEPIIAATDAVVPPDVDENILSFDVTDVAISYIRELEGGAYQAAVIAFDGPSKGDVVPLSDPATRVPIAVQFSPLDPYLFLRSKDVETGREFTIAVVEPFTGTPFASPFTVDDPVFAPDGAYIYGVVNKGNDQLVRVNTNTGRFDLLADQDRICKPQPSSDGKRVVYAGGPTCSEVWVINADGTEQKEVSANVGGTTSFVDGNFSWSLDGSIVSHAACRALEKGASCGGPYLDIRIDGKSIKTRARAGSVRREYRPLVKPLKVKIDVTGPLDYHDRLLISADSAGNLIQKPRDVVVEARGVDQRDARRIFAAKLLAARDANWITGTIGVKDPLAKFNHDMLVFGQVLIQSYRYASFRGVWLDVSKMPFRSGRIDITIYR